MAGKEWKSRSLELKSTGKFETQLLLKLVIHPVVEVSQDVRTWSAEENCELTAQ